MPPDYVSWVYSGYRARRVGGKVQGGWGKGRDGEGRGMWGEGEEFTIVAADAFLRRVPGLARAPADGEVGDGQVCCTRVNRC